MRKNAITLPSVMVAGAASLALASCMTAQPDPASDAEAPQTALAKAEETGRQCFFAEQVNGFRSIEDEKGRRSDTHVLIDVGASDTYEFELLRSCPGLRFARSIALVRQGPGRICDGLDVDLVVQDDISPLRCPVRMVRKLAPGEPYARQGAKE
ncbi:DUF6491 family protein [Erythrobacter sp. THAF29]|uniref:DUF6491 family protein n=1 Tax=Erythrobacter sp. THAF29 TaxID=2587851 RepID=UPI0012A7D1D3|nr:DUF6491 family protein [Erythrobacter sp. THAF29]QFT78799.1 hypothetical protein FIU90_14710 [Erythrobacter sp. THAF29]